MITKPMRNKYIEWFYPDDYDALSLDASFEARRDCQNSSRLFGMTPEFPLNRRNILPSFLLPGTPQAMTRFFLTSLVYLQKVYRRSVIGILVL